MAKVIHQRRSKYPAKALTAGEPRVYMVKPHVMFKSRVMETEIRDDYSAILDKVLAPCGLGKISASGIDVDDEANFDVDGHLSALGYTRYWTAISSTIAKIDQDDIKARLTRPTNRRETMVDKATSMEPKLATELTTQEASIVNTGPVQSQDVHLAQGTIWTPKEQHLQDNLQTYPIQDNFQGQSSATNPQYSQAQVITEYQDYLRFCEQRNAAAMHINPAMVNQVPADLSYLLASRQPENRWYNQTQDSHLHSQRERCEQDDRIRRRNRSSSEGRRRDDRRHASSSYHRTHRY